MKIRELAAKLALPVSGNGDAEVSGIASIRSARSGDLVFAENPKSLSEARNCGTTGIIATEAVPDMPVIISRHPKLDFARAANLLLEPTRRALGVHPSAVVDPTAQIAEDASIGALSVIGPNVRIGKRSIVGPGCVLLGDIQIGEGSELVARVTIYPGTTIGSRVIVQAGAVLGSDGFGYVRDGATGEYLKFPQAGRLEIEDDVEIGANATVDRGALDATLIRRGTKLDNMVHVGHNVTVGTNVVVAAQTGISGSSELGDSVIVGGQVGIADHVRIEEGAILGAQAGIPSNKVIRGEGIVFWGTPARPIKDYLKELAALARLARGRGRQE